MAARALLARGDTPKAQAAMDAAGVLLRDSKDIRLLLRRDVTLATLGRDDGILERALAGARRAGLVGMGFEVRLAMAPPDEGLAGDARGAGFLLVARKAR